jgi:hypothetical protein
LNDKKWSGMSVDLQQVLNLFEPISLEQADKARLMNRVDSKFVISVSQLEVILEEIREDYQVLSVDGIRQMPYRTRYLDTPDFSMFKAHVNGKLNRYKVRFREYPLTGMLFLESKFKMNRNRTIKKRISRRDRIPEQNEVEDQFVAEQTPYHREDLETKLYNRFNRISLIHKTVNERITMDTDICFSLDREHWKGLGPLAVIELKQEHFSRHAGFAHTLRQHGIRPVGFSKYCIGVSMLYPDQKTNQMKRKFLYLNKLTKQPS